MALLGLRRFMALETDAGHSAAFFDMDAREVAGKNGNPRPEALFRTNHGFDPETVRCYPCSLKRTAEKYGPSSGP